MTQALAKGQYRITASDESTVTLVAEGTDELVLDRKRDYGVLQRRWHCDSGEPLKCTIKNAGWTQFADGTWYPACVHLN